MADLITGMQLRKICPNMTTVRANSIADRISFIAPGYGITSPNILHEFIANIAHESGSFRMKEENMNYSAERIVQVWPSRFKSVQSATPYARNPQKLANFVYGGRMGNNSPNDGWDYRGGGFIQLTGKDTYQRYQQFLAFDDLKTLADLIRTDDFYAVDSACWLFAIEKKLIPYALSNSFERIVRSINGGVIGMADRQKYYQRAKLYV